MRNSLTLPVAPEAEVAVIGGLIIDQDAVATVADRLSPEDFHDRRHRLLYSTVLHLWKEGVAPDPVTISETLSTTDELEAAGGLSYLAELMDAVPTAANIGYYVNFVADRAMRRRLYYAAQQIADDALRMNEVKTEEALDRAEQRILQVADSRRVEGPRRIQDLMPEALALAEKGGIKGVPTGLADLDGILGGLKPGNLIILAGATSMGKSAMALHLAANAAIDEKVPTAFFSIEMTGVENTARVLSMEGMVNLAHFLNGKLADDEYPRLDHAIQRVRAARMVLDDSATRVMEIRARARRIKSEHGLGLVVVDHIHDMSEDADSRREEISKIGRGLKQLAKELDVPVIAVSQLSRAPTTRPDPRPRLSDLRESGDLEAVANVVMFMYRPEYYFGPEETIQGALGRLDRKEVEALAQYLGMDAERFGSVRGS